MLKNIVTIILILTNIITTVINQENINHNDIIMTHSGHSEAIINKDAAVNNNNKESKNIKEPVNVPETVKTDTNLNGDVVFVPNANNENDGYSENNHRNVNIGPRDTNNEKIYYNNIKSETSDLKIVEPENQNLGSDMYFVKGKNEEASDPNKNKKSKPDYANAVKTDFKALDCINLKCNNTRKTVCGGKIEHNQWKYRSFFNECFFRKVNCGLKYDINRYIQVDNNKCSHIASDNAGHTYFYQPSLSILRQKLEKSSNDTRRIYASRRSSSLDINGRLCDHSCPLFCPEDYSPECAISSNGLKKVFINHCMLDMNSCTNNIAWRRQPLAVCVGRKQADMRENRAFIGWMQRIGIVDGQGKLVLS